MLGLACDGWISFIIILLGAVIYGVVTVVFAGIAAGIVAAVAGDYLPVVVSGVLGVVAFIIVLVALCWLKFYLDRTAALNTIRRFIRDHTENGRLNICPFCRYNLHGSVSATCPECGEEVIVVHPDEADKADHGRD